MIENAIIKLIDRNGSAQGVNTNNNHFFLHSLSSCACACNFSLYVILLKKKIKLYPVAACILVVRNTKYSIELLSLYILYTRCFVFSLLQKNIHTFVFFFFALEQSTVHFCPPSRLCVSILSLLVVYSVLKCKN